MAVSNRALVCIQFAPVLSPFRICDAFRIVSGRQRVVPSSATGSSIRAQDEAVTGCPQSRQATAAATATRGADRRQARLLHASVQSYLNAAERPYLHLADGGLINDLGERGLLVRTVAGGSLDASFQHLSAGTVRKIMLVSVNSERDIGNRIDRSDRVPGPGQMFDALVFGAGSRATGETLAARATTPSAGARKWRRCAARREARSRRMRTFTSSA